MLYYVTLNGVNIAGFDNLKLAKYKVAELYQKDGLKCNIYFNSYIYSKVGIKNILPNIIEFNTIIDQFENNLI